jgi:hypothetical protein
MVSKEEIHTWILNKIEKENFPLRDKNEFSELRKLCMQEFKLGRGYYGMINKTILDILREKNLVIADLDLSDTIGNLKINLVKAEPITEPSIPIIPPTQPQQTLQELEKIERQPLPPSVEESNIAIFQELFSFVGDIYTDLGIIKVKDVPKMTVKEMTNEEFNKKLNEFGRRVGSFCYRRGIEAPFIMGLISLIGSGFLIFGLPIVKTLFMPNEESKPESL